MMTRKNDPIAGHLCNTKVRREEQEQARRDPTPNITNKFGNPQRNKFTDDVGNSTTMGETLTKKNVRRRRIDDASSTAYRCGEAAKCSKTTGELEK